MSKIKLKQGGKKMLRKSVFVLLVVALGLVAAVPALAAATSEDVVVEGASVPGIALADPDAVIAAYPNALVNYDRWGHILQVKDYELGIQVDWCHDFYSPLKSVGMAIFYPSQPPPPPEPITRVTDIYLVPSPTRLVKVRLDKNPGVWYYIDVWKIVYM
jgi:hypothetical protein